MFIRLCNAMVSIETLETYFSQKQKLSYEILFLSQSRDYCDDQVITELISDTKTAQSDREWGSGCTHCRLVKCAVLLYTLICACYWTQHCLGWSMPKLYYISGDIEGMFFSFPQKGTNCVLCSAANTSGKS